MQYTCNIHVYIYAIYIYIHVCTCTYITLGSQKQDVALEKRSCGRLTFIHKVARTTCITWKGIFGYV